MDHFGAPPVKYTFGRRGGAKRDWVKRSSTPSACKSKATSSKSSRSSTKSGSSGGFVVISEENGDRMVRWWTSQVDDYERVRLELEARVEGLESLNASLRTQLDLALSQASAHPVAEPSAEVIVAAPAPVSVSSTSLVDADDGIRKTMARLIETHRCELEEKDTVIARLSNELRIEANALANLHILMMQHKF